MEELPEGFSLELASNSTRDERGQPALPGTLARSGGKLARHADGELFGSVSHRRILLR
jgi:hypothetical protein